MDRLTRQTMTLAQWHCLKANRAKLARAIKRLHDATWDAEFDTALLDAAAAWRNLEPFFDFDAEALWEDLKERMDD